MIGKSDFRWTARDEERRLLRLNCFSRNAPSSRHSIPISSQISITIIITVTILAVQTRSWQSEKQSNAVRARTKLAYCVREQQSQQASRQSLRNSHVTCNARKSRNFWTLKERAAKSDRQKQCSFLQSNFELRNKKRTTFVFALICVVFEPVLALLCVWKFALLSVACSNLGTCSGEQSASLQRESAKLRNKSWPEMQLKFKCLFRQTPIVRGVELWSQFCCSLRAQFEDCKTANLERQTKKRKQMQIASREFNYKNKRKREKVTLLLRTCSANCFVCGKLF